MIINPQLMKEQQGGTDNAQQKGLMFSISSEPQVQIIGYSEDYDVCKGRTHQQ